MGGAQKRDGAGEVGGAQKMDGAGKIGGAQKMDRAGWRDGQGSKKMDGAGKMGSLWDSQKQNAGGVVKKSGSENCHLHLSFKFRRA